MLWLWASRSIADSASFVGAIDADDGGGGGFGGVLLHGSDFLSYHRGEKGRMNGVVVGEARPLLFASWTWIIELYMAGTND